MLISSKPGEKTVKIITNVVRWETFEFITLLTRHYLTEEFV